MIINMIFVAILSMPFRMLVQVYAKDVYGSDASNVGYLLAAAGIGGLFGSLAIATLRKQNNRGMIFMVSGIISAAALLLVSSRFFCVPAFPSKVTRVRPPHGMCFVRCPWSRSGTLIT